MPLKIRVLYTNNITEPIAYDYEVISQVQLSLRPLITKIAWFLNKIAFVIKMFKIVHYISF